MHPFLILLCPLMLALSALASAAESAELGVPLPIDGGEPGKIVLAALDAQRSGDSEKLKKAFHPRVWKDSEERMRKMLERSGKYSPTSARSLGGTVDGEHANVQIEATFPSATRTSDADLERFEAQWRVTRM